MAVKHDVAVCALVLFIFLLSCMVKQPAFIQPDGISKTLLKEDMYAGMENLCFSSVFSYKNSHGFLEEFDYCVTSCLWGCRNSTWSVVALSRAIQAVFVW